MLRAGPPADGEPARLERGGFHIDDMGMQQLPRRLKAHAAGQASR